MKRDRQILAAILGVYAALTIYGLGGLPGEWYGDISNVHEYVKEILEGKWPWYFLQSAGPVYHYAIAGLIGVIGQKHLQYKLASAAVGGGVVIAAFLLARKLAGPGVARITAFITGVSFWTLVWARTGNSQIIIPILSAIAIYSAEKFSKKPQAQNLLPGIVGVSAGMFTYPQCFVFPIIFSGWLLSRGKVKGMVIGSLGLIPALVIWGQVVVRDANNFTSGYVGQKIPKTEDWKNPETYLKLTRNFFKTAGMLHFKGEVSFRVNVPDSPHLDILSGWMFVLGIIYWWKKDRRMLLRIGAAMMVLALPSMSPAIPQAEIPNGGRAIGIIPLVYLITASGIMMVYERMKKSGQVAATIVLVVILGAITGLNVFKYFGKYTRGLPNHNVPFGKIIAERIDRYSVTTKVFMASCCWGEWGQPEPKAIYYSLKHQAGREDLIMAGNFVKDCKAVFSTRPAVVFFDPRETDQIKDFEICLLHAKREEYVENGEKAYVSLFIGADDQSK